MTVTKRTRFEVLRRDDHACQYCGQKAPDVTLQVDHVVPVALGGSDSPANLLTACRDCNAGKSSISPDSPLVAALSDRSAEYAIANANRNAHIEMDFYAIESYQEEFLTAWNGFTYRKGIKDLHVPLPSDWRSSLSAWWKTGVPENLIQSAVGTAMGAPNVNHEDRFRYFAGVVWRTLDTYDRRYSEQTASARIYAESDIEKHGIEGWRRGYAAGGSRSDAVSLSLDFLMHHIDGTTSPHVEQHTYLRAA